MSTTKKPFGITATAIYTAFSGVIYLLVGVALTIVSQVPGSSNVFMPVGVLMCILGVFMLAAVYGLWSLQEWGRTLALWLSGISVILGIISIFPVWPEQQYTISNAMLQLIGIGISVIIFTYLSKQHIKTIFDITEP